MTPLSRRVLLVEDNDQTREALRLVLEGHGHAVEEADDGQDGVTKALATRPDVIVVDIEMPVFDGYGVARRVREAFGAGVRLIALTGHDNRERALAAGFNTHILKPAEPEDIVRAVQGAG